MDEAPEGWLTREEAIELAIARVLSLDELLWPQAWYGVRDPEPVTEELLRGLSVSAVPSRGTEEGRDVWYVWLYDREWMTEWLDCYAITLDAHSGECLAIFTPGGNG